MIYSTQLGQHLGIRQSSGNSEDYIQVRVHPCYRLEIPPESRRSTGGLCSREIDHSKVTWIGMCHLPRWEYSYDGWWFAATGHIQVCGVSAASNVDSQPTRLFLRHLLIASCEVEQSRSSLSWASADTLSVFYSELTWGSIHSSR